MPQFSVFANPGRNPATPFVVQIQSSRLDRTAGRTVMPLNMRRAASPPDHPLTPHMTVQGEAVYANPLDIATIPATRLGNALGVLDETDQDRVMRALDELTSRA